MKKPSAMALMLKFTMCFALWSLPVGTLGLAVCITIVGIPLGMLLFGLAAMPMANISQTYTKQLIAYEQHIYYNGKDEEMPSEDDVPWIT